MLDAQNVEELEYVLLDLGTENTKKLSPRKTTLRIYDGMV